MKFLAYVCVAALGCLPNVLRGSETAQARLWCLSLRFSEGTAGFGTYLDLGSVSGAPNGELMPVNLPNNDFYSYGSGFVMNAGFGSVFGSIYFQIPALGDANGNGFEDFFEVALGVPTSMTYGTYDVGFSAGTVTATWSRGAGSKNGTCVLNLNDDTFGDLGDFQHTFELIEYTGPVLYTPGTNVVTGTVALTQTGNAANSFFGPVQFDKFVSDPFNKLTLQQGAWLTGAQQSMAFLERGYVRDTSWPTNYYGYFEFVDGDLTTADPDYTTWTLSIDDTNDFNHNGVPDFSDTPSSLPRRPLLSLTRGTTNFWLTIHGDVGHLHTVLQVSNVTSTSWVAVTSITLATDPQTISLPLPAATRTFWRALAQ